MKPTPENVNWVSIDQFMAEQTEAMIRQYRSSKPKPRLSRMGFKEEPEMVKRRLERQAQFREL